VKSQIRNPDNAPTDMASSSCRRRPVFCSLARTRAHLY
jgi:hypothetical protein